MVPMDDESYEFRCSVSGLSVGEVGFRAGIVDLLRGRLAAVDGNTCAGGTAAAPTGLQSIYGVFFITLVDPLVDLAP